MVIDNFIEMRRIFKILLIIFLVFISHEAQAVSPGGIIKAFKGIGKIFKKGADEVPDIGKKIEDLKGGNIKSSSKIDETVLNVDNSSSIKFEEGTLHQIDNLSQDELLEAHNIKQSSYFEPPPKIVANICEYTEKSLRI